MVDRIMYRHQMDRAPVFEDRAGKAGLFGFLEEIQEHGLADERFYAIREFRIAHKSYAGQNKDVEQTDVSKSKQL